MLFRPLFPLKEKYLNEIIMYCKQTLNVLNVEFAPCDGYLLITYNSSYILLKHCQIDSKHFYLIKHWVCCQADK